MKKLLTGTGLLASSVCLTLACSSGAVAQPSSSLPELDVSVEMDGLSKPWDVVQTPDGAILTGERAGRFVVQRPDGEVGELTADLSDLYAEGETGLMGMALARDFDTSRALYTCQGVLGGGGMPGTGSADLGSAGGGGGNSISVFRWTVDENWETLTRDRTVVDDIPASSSGRHGGCRILVAPDGTLFIGTGDTAEPTVPQDRGSLGGKVLHVNPDGTAAPDAPGRIYTLGHRNVQGLEFRPDSTQLYEVEQGPNRDDEFNLLTPGGNYGWRPDRTPFIYDESVPMTDPTRVPDAIEALWSSGEPPAIATPGLTFTDGAAWGEWDRAAVISSQQDEKLVFLKLDADGTAVEEEAVALEGEYGRLRSLTSTDDGSFLLTTDNGNGTDQVLRVRVAQ